MIYAKDIIVTKYVHKACDVVYPTYFIDQGGRKHKLMFTVHEIETAQLRAKYKDFKLHKPWWKLW